MDEESGWDGSLMYSSTGTTPAMDNGIDVEEIRVGNAACSSIVMMLGMGVGMGAGEEALAAIAMIPAGLSRAVHESAIAIDMT